MPFLLPLGHWVNLISEPSNVKLLLMKGVSSPRLSSCILSLTIAPDQSTRIHAYMHRYSHYPKGGMSGAIMPWGGGGGDFRALEPLNGGGRCMHQHPGV